MYLLVLACSFALGFAQQQRIPVVSAPIAPEVRLQPQNGVHPEFQNNQQGPFQPTGMQQPQGQMNVHPLPSSSFTNGQQPMGPTVNVKTPLINGQVNLNPHVFEGDGNIQTPLGDGHLDINGRPLIHTLQPLQPVFVQPLPDQFEQPVAAAQVRPRPGPQPPSQPQQRPLACGFSCSRQATLLMMLDGQFSSAACSDRNADPVQRCNNCCGSIALANGIANTWSAGFPSTNKVDCICCINKQRC